MKLKEGYNRKIILILVVIVVLFSSICIYRQWALLQNLIEEKGVNMRRRYGYQNIYLNELEEITAEIILTNRIPEEIKYDIEGLNENYLEYRSLRNYYRHNYFKDRIEDDNLEEFIGISNSFFQDLRDERVKLTSENMKFLKKVNRKTRDLNSIVNKYRSNIERERYEKSFYSKDLANAINEMNDTFEGFWQSEFKYNIETSKKSVIEKPKLEDVYGKKVFSKNEAKEAAQSFLLDLGEIKKESGGGERLYDNKILESIEFDTDNGYEIEVFIQGGKIERIWNGKFKKLIDKNRKSFHESKINISKEDAINKLIEFLQIRGINSLEILEIEQDGPELNVRFAPDSGGYLNMAADIEGKVDLTEGGRLIELCLDRYWKGLAHNDSGYEVALKGYDRAKQVLKSKAVITGEKLVGLRNKGFSLDFYWRFTTKYDGDEYYIYIDPVTGKEKDVEKVKK